MKKTLLAFAFVIGLGMTAQPQNNTVMQLDSVWIPYSEPWWDTTWFLGSSRWVAFTYDNEGLVTRSYDQIGDQGDGLSSYIHFRYYDYDDRQVCTEIHDGWWDPLCMTAESYVFSYQDGLLFKGQGFYSIDCGGSTNPDPIPVATDYFYDSLGRLVEKDHQRNGVHRTRTTYQYLDHQTVECFEAFESPSSQWLLLSRATKTYSDDGLLMSCLRELHNDSTRLTVFSYNAQGCLTESTMQKRIDGVFVNECRTLCQHNSDGLPVYVHFQVWNGEEWVAGPSKTLSVRIEGSYKTKGYTVSFSDFPLFSGDYLQKQQEQLYDRGIEYMELYYTTTATPSYYVEEETDAPSALSVHPNPSSGRFTVTGGELREIAVYNATGRTVYTTPCNGKTATIDLSDQPDGLYLVGVTDKNGRRSVQKVVKQ